MSERERETHTERERERERGERERGGEEVGLYDANANHSEKCVFFFSLFPGSTEEAVLRKTAEIISYLLRESPLVVEFCLPCKQCSIYS